MPIPIIVYTKGTELPKEGSCYIVAGNGLFIRKNTGLIQATVRVDNISPLEDLEPVARINLPRLPADVFLQALLFLRAVYESLRSEAVVLIHFAPDTQEYKLCCQLQTVTPGGVHYESDERFDGFQLVGSIHSHCDFNAFHSGVDKFDERQFDGVHITVGRVDLPDFFTICCSLVVNNNRFPMEPGKYVGGVRKVAWKPRATYKEEAPLNLGAIGMALAGSFVGFNPPVPRHRFVTGTRITDYTQFYRVSLPKGRTSQDVKFPEEWMALVRKPTVLAQAFGWENQVNALDSGLRKGGKSANTTVVVVEGGNAHAD